MRVIVIGGSGFLGYFTCSALAQRGHQAIAIGLRQPAPGSMPEGATFRSLNVDTCDGRELAALMEGADVVIHAAGADGRNSFRPPAIDGFRHANVEPMRRLMPTMHEARVHRLVIFGSYYTALARLLPHLSILERNAYPASRQEQAYVACTLAGNEIDVTILELPYIFGAAPGRGTLWGYVMDHVSSSSTVTAPVGSTACVTARQVAAAAVGAVERQERGHRHYPIAGNNLTYREIYEHFATGLGLTREFVDADPIATMAKAEADRDRLAKAGIETGYDPMDVARWQCLHLTLDPLPAMEALGFEPDDLGAAIAEAVRATRAHGGAGPASRIAGNRV